MRPYDVDRDGLIPGEAVALVCLEREKDAIRRGARIRALIAGRGESGDARPRTGWGDASGFAQAARAVQLAVAGWPERIGWVAGSGNGTQLDEHELEAVHAGLDGRLPPISSILGQTGESFSSGMLRLLSAIYVLERQQAPGTAGLAHARAPWHVNIVNNSCQLSTGAVLVPSFAQGGANLALVVEQAA
jgi:3-oxoacyl-[acyl-carrier-protein] synthase II